jgi:hypothetical protein
VTTATGTYRAYGPPVKFTAERLERIRRAAAVIEDYERRGFAMSLRQLYYQLVAKALIPNEDRAYNQLGADVTDGRYAGLISWTSIEDRGRSLMGNTYHASPAAAVSEAAAAYHTDKWARQPCRVEVWVEKAALEGVVGAICSQLDVDFFACRGYNSASEQWRAGRRFASYISKGQRPVVLHLGDHDPSGIDMTRDNAERLSLFAGVPVQVIRIALNMDQVTHYAPPPNPAKVTDSRYADYRRAYGEESWEVDALPPEALQRLIDDAVRGMRDEAAWADALEEETADRRELADLVEGLGGDGD